MTAYYNEHDPYAAQWLRNLIDAGHIANGEVDERSVEDVKPSDLKGYAQCHFFAGIGGWSHALRLARWPDDRPVWTGSCPCQPFSTAGKGGGFADERHLWPAWQHLIQQCRPTVVFGEQVASKDGYAWLDLVHTDMEGMGYAFGPVILPAAGFGAPHQRHRIFFVADTYMPRSRSREQPLCDAREKGAEPVQRRTTSGYWANADWLLCRGGKRRPVESGTFPLAHGIPARMGKLRAYGNAIVPQVAAAMISAYLSL